jgi:hypothetical protein
MPVRRGSPSEAAGRHVSSGLLTIKAGPVEAMELIHG